MFISITLFLSAVEAQNVFFPPFYMVSHYPETGRSSDLYIYAINKLAFQFTQISISKDGGLPSSAVETGLIIKRRTNFGCFLKIHEMPRPGLRYGQYQASFSNPLLVEFLPPFAEHASYTFVKPKSGNYTCNILTTFVLHFWCILLKIKKVRNLERG